MAAISKRSFSRREFDEEIVRKALVDRDFRRRLTEQPKAVYAAALGRQIPDEVTIKVLEETGDTIYITIPHSPANISEADAKALASREKTHREPCWGVGDGLENSGAD